MKIKETKESASGKFRYCKIGVDGSRSDMSDWVNNMLLHDVFTSGTVNIGTHLRNLSKNLYEQPLLLEGELEYPVNVSGGVMSWSGTSPGSMSARVGVGDILEWGGNEFSYVSSVSGSTATLLASNGLFSNANKSAEVPILHRTGGAAYQSWGVAATSIATQETAEIISETFDRIAGIYNVMVGITFLAVASDVTARSLRITDWSVMNLPSGVDLLAGEQLYVEYSFEYITAQYEPIISNLDEAEGVPLEWNITSITASGTELTITKNEIHNYVQNVGDNIKLIHTCPKSTGIVNITDSGTSFTVFTVGGLDMAIGDTITIEGAAIAGYNSNWTVASVVEDHTFTVNAATGFGNAGSGGNTRRVVSGDFYDGTYVVSAVIGDDTLRLTSTKMLGNGEGTATISGDVTVELGLTFGQTIPPDLGVLSGDIGSVVSVYYSATPLISRNPTTLVMSSSPTTAGMTLLPNDRYDIYETYPSATNAMTSTIGVKLRTNADFSFRQLLLSAYTTNSAYASRSLLLTFSETQHKLPGFITELYHRRKCYPKCMEGLL